MVRRRGNDCTVRTSPKEGSLAGQTYGLSQKEAACAAGWPVLYNIPYNLSHLQPSSNPTYCVVWVETFHSRRSRVGQGVCATPDVYHEGVCTTPLCPRAHPGRE